MKEMEHSKEELKYLGRWGKEIREDRNYIQNQLAEEVGISPTSLSRFERGEQAINLVFFLELLVALNVTDQEYLELKEGLKDLKK